MVPAIIAFLIREFNVSANLLRLLASTAHDNHVTMHAARSVPFQRYILWAFELTQRNDHLERLHWFSIASSKFKVPISSPQIGLTSFRSPNTKSEFQVSRAKLRRRTGLALPYYLLFTRRR